MTDLKTNSSETLPRKPGCLYRIGRVLFALIIILVALVLIGVVYQTIGTELDKRNFAPRGQLYTVNGHQMHLVCMGEGSPAVILQAGATAESLWWHRVQNQLAERTQVCAYDRPGMGWSESVNGPRDPLTINTELQALLEQAGIPAPYVLAGHSFGSILTRIYAEQYPEAVSGIVLVDSQLVTPKHFSSQSEVDQNRSYWDGIKLVFSAMTRVGLMRFTGNSEFQNDGYPPDIALEIAGLHARNQVIDAYYAENGPAFPALQDASAAAENLGNLPVIVLWASQTYALNEANPLLRPFAEELSTYSSNSVTRIIEGADHGSILGNEQHAQQVSNAILDVLQAAETGEALAAS
jgi:pimeloyl-ACP methyl ester carboxylesterase